MSAPVALVFGSGPNVGRATVRTFQENGYRVAQTSRSVKDDVAADNHMLLECDVKDVKSISRTFDAVRAAWGQPAVVVYNAYGLQKTDPEDPAGSLSISDFESTLNANVIGLFQTIKEAVSGFKSLPDSYKKAFFFTGNNLNEMKPLPGFTTLGAGKSAASYLIADADNAYRKKGFQFYYVDERYADGRAVVSEIDGQAHADYFYGLVKGTLSSPWWSTFVKGEGYVKFPWNSIIPAQMSSGGRENAIPTLSEFSLHITHYFRPSDLGIFFKAFEQTFRLVSAQPNCTFFEVYEDPTYPGKISWVENWRAFTTWFEDDFIKRDFMKEYFRYTDALAIRPKEVQFLRKFGPPYSMFKVDSEK